MGLAGARGVGLAPRPDVGGDAPSLDRPSHGPARRRPRSSGARGRTALHQRFRCRRARRPLRTVWPEVPTARAANRWSRSVTYFTAALNPS